MTLARSGCGCSAPCTCACSGSALDPATGAAPLARVRFNDGALLAAKDLLAEQNAHLWRDRLHALLLHGPGGVIWGLGVTADAPGRLLRIGPGAALDPRGRLLLLEREVCLDVQRLPPAFVDGLTPDPTDGARRAFVVLAFEARADEPVLAMRPVCAEPPETAYARQIDGVRADLAATAPKPPAALLRQWLGRPADAPEDRDGRWLGAAPAPGDVRSMLLELSIGAATQLPLVWEDDTPVPLLLAEVVLAVDGDGLVVSAIDPSGRALIPPTQWAAEVALGVPLASGAVPGPHPVRVIGVQVVSNTVEIQLSAALDATSVVADAVGMWVREANAWTPVDVTPSTTGLILTLTPTIAPAAGATVQLLLRGTGVNALFGDGGAPFAGDMPPSSVPRAYDLTLVATWS